MTSAPSFGELLRALREAAGLSQEDLAERAGISSHAVSALERGTRTRPYPHTVRAIADALSASDPQRAALIAAVPPRRRPVSGPVDAAATGQSRPLPLPATPLRGRDSELARVSAMVRERARRLVTLTGTGGVGKTRLSLAVADAVAADFVDGVVFIELAPVLEPDSVLPAVADAVDAGTPEGGDPATAIITQLRGRQVLLVLDNFEHVLGAAEHVARLIESVPGLTVLVTSRAPLRLRGETEVLVEPLALPPADESAATGPRSAAVELFLERAQAVSPRFGTAASDARHVSGICIRLAGIPLALELAAARTRFLDAPTLLARLDDVALEGARDLPARQRTMTATLDWSYGLLQPDEQALLRTMSVFAGGVRLDDLEAVAAATGTVRREDVLRLLAALVEQSLVVRTALDGTPVRFRLLEPVAQYAHGKLVAADEADTVTTAHTEHFLELAEEAAPEYQRAAQVSWLTRIDAEHANLTAALERSLASQVPVRAARLGWALWMYWWLRGHIVHGRRHMEAVLAHELPDPIRAKAELAAATAAFAMDDIEASRSWWVAAEAHAAGGDDPVTTANAVAGQGLAALALGDLRAAQDFFERAVPFADAGGARGEWTAALNQIWLGTVAMLVGDSAGAADHIAWGLASARRRGDRLTIYVALYNLSQSEVARGGHDVARGHLEEGTRLSMETGDLANLAYFLDALAVLEAADGRQARVPLLLGAAQAIREAIGSHGYGYYRPDPSAIVDAADQARQRLGTDRYDDALDMGRAMSPDEAARLALSERVRPT